MIVVHVEQLLAVCGSVVSVELTSELGESDITCIHSSEHFRKFAQKFVSNYTECNGNMRPYFNQVNNVGM